MPANGGQIDNLGAFQRQIFGKMTRGSNAWLNAFIFLEVSWIDATWNRKRDPLSAARGQGCAIRYIMIFYNQRRHHSSIGYRTPAQARRVMTSAQAA